MDPLKFQPQQETRLHFLDYWRIIRIRKTVIIAVFLLVVITATLVTFILPESFASTARIKVERDKSDIEELSGKVGYNPYDPYFIQTEFEVIQSELILGRVIDQLDLNTEWGKKYNDGQKLKTQETLTLLRNRISLRPVRNTMLIDIQVYSDNPVDAAKLANTIAESYKGFRLEQGLQLTGGGLKALDAKLKEQDENIRKAKEELNTLRTTLAISDIDAAGSAPQMLMEQEQYRKYEQTRFEREVIYKSRKQEYDKVLALSSNDTKVLREVLPRIQPDPTLTELITELNAADQKAKSMSNDLGPKSPELTRISEQQALLNEKIDRAVEGSLKAMETQVAVAKAGLDSLVESVESARLLDAKKLTESRPYFDKKKDLLYLEDMRQLLKRRMTVEDIDKDLPKSAQVIIIERGQPGLKPVRPNKPLNIVLGVVIGLVVGVGLAFFIEYLDTSVKTIDDVERTLQSPVLGVIPQNVGLLIEEGAESPHAEAYRVLRTNLIFARKDDKLNTAAVVSAGAGEGKSTTVLNLATVFAQSGQRVVIVDSDLRRPTLHKLLRCSNNLGLTNYLLKQNTLEEVVQRTSLPTLDLLASGKLPSSSLGILSSSQMKELINDLKQRYDFVFFDSPPIMGVSDASILASEVDMTIQVIQYPSVPAADECPGQAVDRKSRGQPCRYRPE
ncbi:MAG: polysaccharide biosynthesis tyrosine autokinase [Verrucomicrobiota bacterium]